MTLYCLEIWSFPSKTDTVYLPKALSIGIVFGTEYLPSPPALAVKVVIALLLESNKEILTVLPGLAVPEINWVSPLWLMGSTFIVRGTLGATPRLGGCGLIFVVNVL